MLAEIMGYLGCLALGVIAGAVIVFVAWALHDRDATRSGTIRLANQNYHLVPTDTMSRPDEWEVNGVPTRRVVDM